MYSLLCFNYSIYIIFFISGYSSFLKFTEEEIIILVLMAIHQHQGWGHKMGGGISNENMHTGKRWIPPASSPSYHPLQSFLVFYWTKFESYECIHSESTSSSIFIFVFLHVSHFNYAFSLRFAWNGELKSELPWGGRAEGLKECETNWKPQSPEIMKMHSALQVHRIWFEIEKTVEYKKENMNEINIRTQFQYYRELSRGPYKKCIPICRMEWKK